MKKEAIKLLNQSLEKIDAKDFDMESWKQYNIILLTRIFGKDNQKIKQLENLENEYNSWSLRDAVGNESYEDGTIKLVKEIINASIDEINAFGVPQLNNTNLNMDLELLLNSILDELKGSQVKNLKSILNSKESDAEKKRRVFEIIGKLGESSAYEIITNIIIQKSIREFFKD